jgi:UPF0755 protein
MSARRTKQKRGRKYLAAALLISALFWTWREIGGRGSRDATQRILIPKGSTMRAAADSLAASGVIGTARLFRWYVSAVGGSTSIQPGSYRLPKHASYASVLEALVKGRGIVHVVAIPEGFDSRDITRVVAKALKVPEDSVRAAMMDSAWRERLDVPAPSLEGYLFPATYTFLDGTSARSAVEEMLKRFEIAWKPAWNARLDSMGITRHDAMTMASIVEKEARVPEERAIIAAVYWNRIRKGMRLQADPTVQYALPNHVERVMFKDLDIESRYNTYKYGGLPPGPIASPGEASIVAALNPASVPYLYFVAHPDGHHEFRTSYNEHLRAIAMIKRQQRTTPRVNK